MVLLLFFSLPAVAFAHRWWLENWLNATFRVHLGEQGRAEVDTHTHSEMGQFSPCPCILLHNPLSLLSPRLKTSPIGFFYASKFLVSQPATLPAAAAAAAAAPVGHGGCSRFPFGTGEQKSNAAGLMALEMRKNCIGSSKCFFSLSHFLFPISKHKLLLYVPCKDFSFFRGGCSCTSTKLRQRSGNGRMIFEMGWCCNTTTTIRTTTRKKNKVKSFQVRLWVEFIFCLTSFVFDFPLSSLTFEGFLSPYAWGSTIF